MGGGGGGKPNPRGGEHKHAHTCHVLYYCRSVKKESERSILHPFMVFDVVEGSETVRGK